MYYLEKAPFAIFDYWNYVAMGKEWLPIIDINTGIDTEPTIIDTTDTAPPLCHPSKKILASLTKMLQELIRQYKI